VESGSRILACVDQSRYADYVTDYAAWIARRLDASLELLHIIDKHPEIAKQVDRSGAIGVDAQENLLDELSRDEQSRNREAREHGRLFLNRLRERAVAAGVPTPDIRQRNGSLQETLLEQEQDVSLFVLGRRGRSAEITQRDLGRNVESVVRALQKPILTVTQDFTQPQRVMIAFDGGTLTRRGVQIIAQSPLFRGLPVDVLMSGKARPDARKELDWAQGKLEAAGFTARCEMIPGDAESVIAGAVLERGIDILVMGAYSHSRLRAFLLGSKTSDLLRSARIPTLLIR